MKKKLKQRTKYNNGMISESQAKYFQINLISETDNPSKVYVQGTFYDHDVIM